MSHFRFSSLNSTQKSTSAFQCHSEKGTRAERSSSSVLYGNSVNNEKHLRAEHKLMQCHTACYLYTVLGTTPTLRMKYALRNNGI